MTEQEQQRKRAVNKTPEEIRAKLDELQKILVLFPPGRSGARISIRDQIKILYWVLGELDDKDLG